MGRAEHIDGAREIRVGGRPVTALEDLAGNRVGRVFDVDTFGEVTRQITKEKTTLTFRID